MELNGPTVSRADTKEFFQSVASPVRAFTMLCDPAHPHYRMLEKALYALDKMEAFLDDDFRTLWRMEQHEATTERTRAEQLQVQLEQQREPLSVAPVSDHDKARAELAYLSTFSEIQVPSLEEWLSLRPSLRDYILKRADTYPGCSKGREAAYALKVALAMKRARDEKSAAVKSGAPTSPITLMSSFADIHLTPQLRPAAPAPPLDLHGEDTDSCADMPPLVEPGTDFWRSLNRNLQ